jgi:prepilin-type N-terminal cleavage/methylation domain-containing protein
MKDKLTSGFTILELLVVIVIIGTLAAVLMPNLLNARNRAYDIATVAFLREVATEQFDNYSREGTYAASVAALDAPPTTPSYLDVLSESGDTNTFCVSAKASPSASKTYRVSPNGIELGTCS